MTRKKKNDSAENKVKKVVKGPAKKRTIREKVLEFSLVRDNLQIHSKKTPVRAMAIYDAINGTTYVYMAEGNGMAPEDRASFLSLDEIRVADKENTWAHKLPSGDWKKLPLVITAIFHPAEGSDTILHEMQIAIVEKQQGGQGLTVTKPKIDETVTEKLATLMVRASCRNPNEVVYIDSNRVNELLTEMEDLRTQIGTIPALQEEHDRMGRELESSKEQYEVMEGVLNELKRVLNLAEEDDYEVIPRAVEELKNSASGIPALEAEIQRLTSETPREETTDTENITNRVSQLESEATTREARIIQLEEQLSIAEGQAVRVPVLEQELSQVRGELNNARSAVVTKEKLWLWPWAIAASLLAIVFFVLFITTNNNKPVPAAVPANDENKVSRESYSNLQTQFSQAQNTASRVPTLEGQVTVLTTEKTRLEGQVATLTGERDTARAESTRLTGELATVRGQLTQSQQTASRVPNLERQIASLTEEKTQLTSRVATLTEEKTTLQERVRTLEGQVTTLTSERDTFRTQVSGHNATITQLRTDLTNAQTAHATAENERNAAREERDTARAESTRLTGELTTVRGQLTQSQQTASRVPNLERQIASLTEEKTQLTSRVATLTEEKTTLQGRVRTLEGQVATLTSERDTARTQVAGHNITITQLRTDLSNTQTQATERQTALEQERTTVSSLRSQLRERNTGIETLNGQLQTALGERDSARAQITRLNGELTDMRSQLVDAQAQASLVPGLRQENQRLSGLLSPVRVVTLESDGRLSYPSHLAPVGTRLWQVQGTDRQTPEPQNTADAIRITHQDRIFFVHFFNEYGGLIRTYVVRAPTPSKSSR